ncbi:MAG: hypothetical protein ACR2PG_05305 [Hyphomicrobiaceae bacterium]
MRWILMVIVVSGLFAIEVSHTGRGGWAGFAHLFFGAPPSQSAPEKVSDTAEILT